MHGLRRLSVGDSRRALPLCSARYLPDFRALSGALAPRWSDTGATRASMAEVRRCMMTRYQIVGANIDTWLINVKGKLPDGLAEELDFLKEASQEADEDIPTRWAFAGETLFIRAHGSGRQWRWILHCPSLHLDIGEASSTTSSAKRGCPQRICGSTSSAKRCTCSTPSSLASTVKASPSRSVKSTYAPTSRAGSSPSTMLPPSSPEGIDARRTPRVRMRGRARGRVVRPSLARAQHDGSTLHGIRVQQRRAHSCTIYDKTKEITVSRKDWMQEVWRSNGWDGEQESRGWSSATNASASRSWASRIPTSCSTNSPACGRTPRYSGCATPSPLSDSNVAAGSARRSGRRSSRRLLRQWHTSRPRTQARRRSALDLSDARRLLDHRQRIPRRPTALQTRTGRISCSGS